MTYYKQHHIWQSGWTIFKRAKAGGDRQMADGLSESFAALMVRLLNEDEARRASDPTMLNTVEALAGEDRD